MTVTETYTDPSEAGTLDRDQGDTLTEAIYDGILGNLLHLGDTAGAVRPKVMGIRCRNESGATINAGDLVHVSGWSETQTRSLLTLADADAAGRQAMYVATNAIANNANGFVYKRHRLTGLNTGGSAVGDPVYLSTTAGGWTLTAPTASNALQQVVGRVAVVHASTGEIEFDLASHQINKFGSNELQTGAGGKVKQMVSTVTGAVATGTTQIPQDDTIPQNTEGDEYMTLAITPVSATSNLKIQVTAHFAVNGGANVAMALFVDSTANALAVAAHESGAVSGAPIHATLTHVVASASTSARTYKVRAGPNGGVTVTFNGAGGARLFGGVYTSSIVITEIEA